MAERVVSALRLQEEKHFRQASQCFSFRSFDSVPKKTQKLSSAELQARAASHVMSNVSISPVTQSRLVDLTYLDPSPIRAQQISNAYAGGLCSVHPR